MAAEQVEVDFTAVERAVSLWQAEWKLRQVAPAAATGWVMELAAVPGLGSELQQGGMASEQVVRVAEAATGLGTARERVVELREAGTALGAAARAVVEATATDLGTEQGTVWKMARG